MKLLSLLALFGVPLSFTGTRITYDTVYDNGTESLAVVACSNGPNGMLTKGYKIFKDLPTFPNIGGSSAVAGWNSPNCGSPRFAEFDVARRSWFTPSTGTCWNVTYGDETITVTVIDYAGDGYNLSEESMNTLTYAGFFSSFFL